MRLSSLATFIQHNNSFGSPTTAIREQKEIKGNQIGKEEKNCHHLQYDIHRKS